MEPILNLFNCFTEETTAGEVRAHLEATGQRIRNDGAGNLVLVARNGYDNPVLETKRQRALCVLDTLPKADKWVSGPTVLRGAK